MKRIIGISLLYFLSGLAAISSAQNKADSSIVIDIDDPYQYLPNYLENINIGMTLAEFSNIKDALLLSVSEDYPDLWYGVREEVTEDGIREVDYKFDKDENDVKVDRPLYEINIIFSDSISENGFLQEKFGEPQKESGTSVYEWKFRTNKDYQLFIKQKDKEVQIFAAMTGTEYEKKNDF